MFTCFTCKKQDYEKNLHKYSSFRTAFISLNTLYTINNNIRLCRYSKEYNILFKQCELIKYINDNEEHKELYRQENDKKQMNISGCSDTNIINQRCKMIAKRFNVPLLHFIEVENYESIQSFVNKMNMYRYDQILLLNTIQSMNHIKNDLKNAIMEDILMI